MKAANFCLSGFFALAAALFLTTASAEQGDMPVLPNGAAAVLTSVVQLPAELPASAFGAGDSRTYYVRVSDPEQKWSGTLLWRDEGSTPFILYGQPDCFIAEMGTTRNNRPLTTEIPHGEMASDSSVHDLVLRINNRAKMEFFLDGRCYDEDFMLGDFFPSDAPIQVGSADFPFTGQILVVAIWDRALSDDEIASISGDMADHRSRTDRGTGESLQYWMPPNHYGVGDCMPFYADGVFHFMYLLDKGHHSAKNGLGAHQWIQATSTDLVHWEHQGFVVEIDQQFEGSICTGSVFFHDGKYYAFYANRSAVYPSDDADSPVIKGILCRSVSDDGIHFVKDSKPIFELPEGYGAGTRDPVVFQDPETELFHLYATTSFHGYGCWAHLVSADLEDWTLLDPVYTYKDGEPECPDWFRWGDRYYTIANHLNGYWRWSSSPTGPWDIPPCENILMPGIINVPKTAPFGPDRRIICGWTREHGFGGHAVFHELVRHDDGTLGEKFVPEMIPATGSPLALDAPGTQNQAAYTDLPGNYRMKAVIQYDPQKRDTLRNVVFNLGSKSLTVSFCRRAITLGDFTIQKIDFSSGSMSLDLVICGDLADLCVDSDRTVTETLDPATTRNLTIDNPNAEEVNISALEIAPLAPQHED
ncbi:MAG: hypothetical protein IKE64_00520 [Thermoguttaceae bacterium]|nr:hypothetical protein [Thermoguttaceae bacterium]